ncbi:MAG: hypothetical protein K6E30_11220 [Lachnospiraceae bacterium]|nr:hypothetical protein [Lachnospiraceae bacterium]
MIFIFHLPDETNLRIKKSVLQDFFKRPDGMRAAFLRLSGAYSSINPPEKRAERNQFPFLHYTPYKKALQSENPFAVKALLPDSFSSVPFLSAQAFPPGRGQGSRQYHE